MKQRLVLTLLLGCLLSAAPASAQQFVGRHSLRAGIGLLGYFSGRAPGTSGAWDLRYTYNPIRPFGFELAYTGAAGSTVGGVGVATILTGGLKVNPVLGAISPFIAAGVGYGAFGDTGPRRGDLGTLVVPLSAGVDFRAGRRFITSVRFTYHLTLFDQLGAERANADSWMLGASLGSSF